MIDWKQKKADARAARIAKREENTAILLDLGIRFDSYGEGRHLKLIDYGLEFYPATDKWYDRNGKKRFGIVGLIDYLKKCDMGRV